MASNANSMALVHRHAPGLCWSSWLQLNEVLESSRLPQGICIHFINTDLMAVLCGNLHKLLCADLLLHRLLQIGALKDRLEKAFQRRA